MLSILYQNDQLKSCAKRGIKAIKRCDRKKFKIDDIEKLKESVDIDSCFKEKYPNDNRWDYLVLVDMAIQGYFVEIHPAITSEVSTMIAKKQWLQNEIINVYFKTIDKTKYKIIWVATDAGMHILKTSKEYKRLAKENLIPQKICRI